MYQIDKLRIIESDAVPKEGAKREVLTPSKSKCRKCKSDMANRYAIFRAYTTKNLKPKTGKYHD